MPYLPHPTELTHPTWHRRTTHCGTWSREPVDARARTIDELGYQILPLVELADIMNREDLSSISHGGG